MHITGLFFFLPVNTLENAVPQFTPMALAMKYLVAMEHPLSSPQISVTSLLLVHGTINLGQMTRLHSLLS